MPKLYSCKQPCTQSNLELVMAIYEKCGIPK